VFAYKGHNQLLIYNISDTYNLSGKNTTTYTNGIFAIITFIFILAFSLSVVIEMLLVLVFNKWKLSKKQWILVANYLLLVILSLLLVTLGLFTKEYLNGNTWYHSDNIGFYHWTNTSNVSDRTLSTLGYVSLFFSLSILSVFPYKEYYY